MEQSEPKKEIAERILRIKEAFANARRRSRTGVPSQSGAPNSDQKEWENIAYIAFTNTFDDFHNFHDFHDWHNHCDFHDWGNWKDGEPTNEQ